jgi:ketosteroid isomerase-like protein
MGFAAVLLGGAVVAGAAQEELLPLLAQYEEAFEAGDAKDLGELYWHDERLTVFWPEPETAFRIDGWAQWQRYLAGFTALISQLPPGSMNLQIRQPTITVLGDVAIVTSYWTGTMLMPELGGQVMQGRESQVWKKIDDRWVIIHEHTSLFPTPP